MQTSVVFVSLWALVSAIALASCDSEAAPPPATAAPPTEVTTVDVAVRQIHPADELTGRVEAVAAVEIRPRVSGYVDAVRYREGDEVAAGTVLFVIDPRPYRAAMARATAEHVRAKARLDLARIEVGRAEKLLAANAIARSERDTQASTAAQAEAEVQAAAAAVQLAALDLEQTSVRAPIAGRTGRAMVTKGDFVAAGPAPTELTTVVSVDPIHVYFEGDEQLGLRYGSRASSDVAHIGLAHETGFPHEGKVDFIDNRVDAATGTIRLRAVVPNPDKQLMPGLYARVKLAEARTVPALLVDDAAILTDQDRRYVFVVNAGSAVERRDVKLGKLVEGQRIVTDGLRAGDRVIVGGLQKVGPGAKVAPKPRGTK